MGEDGEATRLSRFGIHAIVQSVRSECVSTRAELGDEPKLARFGRHRALDTADGDSGPESHDYGNEENDTAPALPDIDVPEAGNQPGQKSGDRHSNHRRGFVIAQWGSPDAIIQNEQGPLGSPHREQPSPVDAADDGAP